MFFMMLRNTHLGKSCHIIKEEEIELKMNAKKKVNEKEELKDGIDRIEFQSVKTPEDLGFLKHEEATAIAEIEQKLIRPGVLKDLINYF